MAASVETVFDVAAWLMDHALNDNEYLQPMKMHRLLYLAHGYFGVAYHGRKMSPAVFVATETGPIEPNVFRAFEQGRPAFYLNTAIDKTAETFLESIWRRFGPYSADKLAEITMKTTAYQKAIMKGNRTEIPFDSLVTSLQKPKEAPTIDKVIKPRVLKSQDGRPVEVKPWGMGLRKVAQATPLPSKAKKKQRD